MSKPKQTLEEKRAYNNSYYYKNREVIQAQRKVLYDNNLRHKMKHILTNCRQNAKLKGLAFDVSYDYCLELYNNQNKLCALSGEELTISGDRYLSNMLSLDRIDSNQGYIEGNVQWVCVKYNMMKAHADVETFIKMCKRIVEYNNGQT